MAQKPNSSNGALKISIKDGGKVPECYKVDPFIKNIVISSTISMFEVADFSNF